MLRASEKDLPAYMIFKFGKRQAADDEGPLYLPTWYMALLKSSKVVNLRTN